MRWNPTRIPIWAAVLASILAAGCQLPVLECRILGPDEELLLEPE